MTSLESSTWNCALHALKSVFLGLEYKNAQRSSALLPESELMASEEQWPERKRYG